MRVDHRVFILGLLLACDPGKGDLDTDVWVADDSTPTGADDSGRVDDTGGTGDSSDTQDTVDTGEPFTEDPPELYTCEEAPLAPFDWEDGAFVPPSEDFAFSADGGVVNIDPFSNLVRSDFFGNRTVLVPGMGYAAGISFLADGDLAVADVSAGSVKRISMDGSVTTLTSGLAYPNGLSVGMDNHIYVAENGGNRVRRIDPDSGDYEIISDEVIYPNGVTFSPDYSTVYVGSFGMGFIYALRQDDDGVWQTRVHGHIPPVDDNTPCDGLTEEDECLMTWGGVGSCQTDISGNLECNIAPRDTGSCDGLIDGDPCTTSVLGETVESLCTTGSNGELFCPSHNTSAVTECEGKVYGQPCTAEDGGRGMCYTGWEGLSVCVGNEEIITANQTCDGMVAGDACVYDLPYSPSPGTCTARGDDLICTAETVGSAGLDGINADSCGNVYVTEYGPGIVWQISPDGETTEKAVTLTSSWIPNMHFGLGVGGFHRNVLYVMDYTMGGLFKVYLGVEGKPELVMPE